MPSERGFARTAAGLAATVAWVFGVSYLVVMNRSQLSEMSLEQWGGFLGGVVGPVAFLWLILGYFQQGEELRLNTEALRLQQEELRRQVEETGRLALYAGEQAQIAREAVNLEIKRDSAAERARRTQAQIVLRHAGGTTTGADGELRFENSGGRGRKLRLEGPPGSALSISPTDVLQAGAGGVIYYKGITNYPTKLKLAYSDDFGEDRTIILELPRAGLFVQHDAAI